MLIGVIGENVRASLDCAMVELLEGVPDNALALVTVAGDVEDANVGVAKLDVPGAAVVAIPAVEEGVKREEVRVKVAPEVSMMVSVDCTDKVDDAAPTVEDSGEDAYVEVTLPLEDCVPVID